MKHYHLSRWVIFTWLTTIGIGIAHADDDDEYEWEGFYLGVNAGYGWHDIAAHFSPIPSGTGSYSPNSLTPDIKGIMGGGQAGYNWEIRQFVVGLEADFALADLHGKEGFKGTYHFNGSDNTTLFTMQETIHSLGSIRGRFGIEGFENFLFYATAGWAYGDVRYNGLVDYEFFTNPVQTFPDSFNKIQTGWTAGGGLEYKLNENFALKAEYLYFDLGDVNDVANPAPARIFLGNNQVKYSWQTRTNILRLGVNYLF